MTKRYKEDNIKARKHIYANNAKGPCPYEDGTRAAKLWHKWRIHYINMENMCDEMALVYGEWRPHKKGPAETEPLNF